MAPHPDDEVIGAWGLMRACRRRGARVSVLVVSDGGASHPGSRTWPQRRLIRERRRETVRALVRLSIPPSYIRFLALPDGRLSDRQAVVDKAIGRALRRMSPPALIVGPVPDDAHADHRAVAHALARLPRRGERRLGYRVWPHDARRAGAGLGIGLGLGGMAGKRCAIRGYRTQTGMITDATAGFAITGRHLSAFVRPVERFEWLA